MSYTVRFTAEALKDIDDAFEYYEEQQSGLGVRFLKSLHEKEIFISNSPFASQEVSKGRRRGVLAVFKFNIIYRIDEGAKTAIILAVMHGSRNPERWEKR